MPRILASSPHIVSAASLSTTITSELHKCPSDTYVIVSQPGVNAADFHDRFSAPHLRQNIAEDKKNIRSSMIVSNVLGALDVNSMSKEVQEKCGAEVLHVDASSKWSRVVSQPPRVQNKNHLLILLFSQRWLIQNR